MNDYLHQKLSRSLLREMASGQYRAGQRFLSLRDIERIWKVSEPTIRTSLAWLASQGLVQSRPRSGYYLTRDFYPKALLLLRRSRRNKLPPLVTWLQRARQLQPEHGGRIALLLEEGRIPPSPEESSRLPHG